MLAKLNMNKHCAAASRDLTPNETVTTATEGLFQDDQFVLEKAQSAMLRTNQSCVWWSELEAHIQALPALDIETQALDEKLLATLRTLGSQFSVNATL